ncbi:MAG: ImmA/IrrE family metallo-endopeptidase [Mollicutes bacterium]|nr:ImmA/IrrE family metallo-endopeptidase [Mollicutes bacterium]
MGKLFTTPLKIIDIRKIADQFRHFLKLDPYKSVNVAKLLDVLSILWKDFGFQYLVLPDDDSIFGTQEEAKTDISSGMIYIKESVMEEACCCANKRASFTIAHEIGHFILHRMLGGVNLARSTSVKKTKIYEDPEWQANTFASEFLMPFEAARNMSIDEIRRTYCVSKDCARVRFEKVRGECLNDEIEQYLQN